MSVRLININIRPNLYLVEGFKILQENMFMNGVNSFGPEFQRFNRLFAAAEYVLYND